MCFDKLIESTRELFTQKKEKNCQKRVDDAVNNGKKSSERLNNILKEVKIKKVKHG